MKSVGDPDVLAHLITRFEALGPLAAPAEALPSAHFMFGVMTMADWRSWAYRHTGHHLRQFGL